MLFKRQKVLLGLLSALGGDASAVDFQKLLFLFCSEEESEPSYEFVPHHRGCYSFTSIADRRKLTDKGWLKDHDKTWCLAKPITGLPHELNIRLHGFVKRTAKFRGDALVRDTYRRYPQTAWRSEIKERVLKRHPGVLKQITKLQPIPTTSGIATIGYEGKSLARANRVYPGKDFGLIVDYNGMLPSLRRAFAQYALGDGASETKRSLNPWRTV